MGLQIKPKEGGGFLSSYGNSTPAITEPSDLGRKIIREIPPTLGFIAGEALGGPPGAAIGSGLGETISQAGENILGQRQGFDVGKIVESTAAGVIAPPAFKALGIVGKASKEALSEGLSFAGKKLEPLTNIVKAGLTGIKKVLPGISDETANTIKLFPREVEVLAKQKTLPLNPLLEKLDAAKNALREKTGTEFSSGLENTKKLYPFGKTGKILIGKEMANETAGLPAALRKYRIGVSQDGTLNFDKFPSAIRSQGERNAVQDAYNLVKNQTDFSVQGVQDTAAALRQATNYVAGDRTVSSASAGAISDAYEKAIVKAYPELTALRGTYGDRQKLLGVLEQLTPDNKAMTELLSPQGISRLRSLTKEEIGTTYKGFFDALKKETGIDLETELRLYSAAREINPNLIPQDVGGITRGVQKAANPLVGAFHIEAQKFLQSTPAQVVKTQFPQVWEFLKTVAEKGAQAGTFEGIKTGVDSVDNLLRGSNK